MRTKKTSKDRLSKGKIICFLECHIPYRLEFLSRVVIASQGIVFGKLRGQRPHRQRQHLAEAERTGLAPSAHVEHRLRRLPVRLVR